MKIIKHVIEGFRGLKHMCFWMLVPTCWRGCVLTWQRPEGVLLTVKVGPAASPLSDSSLGRAPLMSTLGGPRWGQSPCSFSQAPSFWFPPPPASVGVHPRNESHSGFKPGCRASLVAQLVKNPPAMWDTWVQSLGQQDTLEKGKATHSSKNT